MCRVSCVVCRGSWVVGRGSWVVGRGSWVVCRVSCACVRACVRPVVPSSTHVCGAFACLQVDLLRTRVSDRNTSYERPAPVENVQLSRVTQLEFRVLTCNVQLSPSDTTRVSCANM